MPSRPEMLPVLLCAVLLGLAACGHEDGSGGGQQAPSAANEDAPQADAAPAGAAGSRSAAQTVVAPVAEGAARAPVPAAAPQGNGAPAPGLPGQLDAVTSPPDKDAAVFSPEPEFDFGEVLQGEKREHTFTVGNRGAIDHTIRAVNPTCGCFIAEVTAPDGRAIDPRKHPPNTDMMTLKPGEEAKVKVELNSFGQRVGKLQKQIIVISSDNRQPALRLTLSMTIAAGVQVEPNPLQFGEVLRGQTKTARAWIKLKQLTDLEITGWVEKPDFFEVAYEKSPAPDGSPAIALDVTLLPNAPVGYIAPALVAKTNNARLQQVQVQLYANVKSQVVFSTGNQINNERIDFEVIPFGESRTRSVEITNASAEEPYVVESVEIESKYQEQIKVALEELERGMRYKITLTTDPSLDARFFRGILKVKAEHVDTPEKQIHFHGWVKKS
ncbi:MAG: DUF1573 domain-containing protein [Planctomycetes bacterium]|nr:DUF1573 domain-containing protein [Planctomycetota bacterium]